MRWLAVTNKNQCPSSPRAQADTRICIKHFPRPPRPPGDIITSWGAGTGQSVARCLGVSLHLIEIQECVGRRVEEEVPTCHTGPLTTPALQSADTVSDIVILSTRWTAASSELLVVDGTEARHLVLTRDTNACSSGDVSQVTWPAEPSSDFHGPIHQESVAS